MGPNFPVCKWHGEARRILRSYRVSWFLYEEAEDTENCHQVCGRAPYPGFITASYLRINETHTQASCHVTERSRAAALTPPPPPWYSKALQPKKDLELRPLPTFPHERIEKSWFHRHHGPKSDTSKWAQAM